MTKGCMSLTIGGHNFKVPEKTYIKGSEFLGNYFNFPISIKRFNHYEFKNVAFLAGMGQGKSTNIRSIVAFVLNVFGVDNVNVIQTDSVEIAVANADEKPFQLFIIDDAVNENDSRLSGGVDRAIATQNYFMIRHSLAEKYPSKGGIVFPIWSYQHINAIDTRFRSLCDVIFVKSTMRSPAVRQLLNNNKSLMELLEDITRQNMYNNYEARRLAIGSTIANDLVCLHTDYIPESALQIRVAYGESDRQKYTQYLFETLGNQPISLIAGQRRTILGFFETIRHDDPRMDRYHINESDISRIINEICYVKRVEIAKYLDKNKSSNDDDEDDSELIEQIRKPKIEGLDFNSEMGLLMLSVFKQANGLNLKELAKKVGIPRSTLARKMKQTEDNLNSVLNNVLPSNS